MATATTPESKKQGDNDKKIMPDPFDSSVGINIPQTLIALLEGYLITGNSKKTLLYGISVALSNLAPGTYLSNYPSGEKYIIEPVIAGVLAALGANLMKIEKSSNLKYFSNGFIIGSSSAAVLSAILRRKYYESITESGSYAQLRRLPKDTGPFSDFSKNFVIS